MWRKRGITSVASFLGLLALIVLVSNFLGKKRVGDLRSAGLTFEIDIGHDTVFV